MTLKELRLRHEYSQHSLARHIKINQGTISKIEAGIQYPSFRTAQKLSLVYNCTVGDIFNACTKSLQKTTV